MINISKAVIEKGGKYLLLKRATTSYPGTWDFAGGKDDPGEMHVQSVIRETKEETNFDIVPGVEGEAIEYIDKDRHYAFHYFVPEQISGDLKISKDHSDVLWATREEIEGLELHPSVALYFDWLKTSEELSSVFL